MSYPEHYRYVTQKARLLHTDSEKDFLRDIDPDGFECIPKSMFDDSESILTPELEMLWHDVSQVYTQAERCHKKQKDEQAWTEVVRRMLSSSGMGNLNDMIDLDNV